ncbi:MAG: YraN family protein [Isosphaeraceae bacterium]
MNRLVRALWNRVLGDKGERLAADFLRRRGFRVITRGYRTARGEIDLIARDRDTLVFIEVKTRRRGQPTEAVTPEKQRRLTLAALSFLHRFDLPEQRCRFDVVAIVWPEENHPPSIEHILNAFEPPGRGQFFR